MPGSGSTTSFSSARFLTQSHVRSVGRATEDRLRVEIEQAADARQLLGARATWQSMRPSPLSRARPCLRVRKSQLSHSRRLPAASGAPPRRNRRRHTSAANQTIERSQCCIGRVTSCRYAGSSSTSRCVGRDDPEEIVGFEAGAADQRAVDIGDAHQLARVARLDRAAVEQCASPPPSAPNRWRARRAEAACTSATSAGGRRQARCRSPTPARRRRPYWPPSRRRAASPRAGARRRPASARPCARPPFRRRRRWR